MKDNKTEASRGIGRIKSQVEKETVEITLSKEGDVIMEGEYQPSEKVIMIDSEQTVENLVEHPEVNVMLNTSEVSNKALEPHLDMLTAEQADEQLNEQLNEQSEINKTLDTSEGAKTLLEPQIDLVTADVDIQNRPDVRSEAD